MRDRHVSRRSVAAAVPAAQTLGFGLSRTMILAAMVALLALALIRPAAGANQSGPTVSEISWGLSGLCRALGGIDTVNPTRNGGGLLNVYFKCKGGYLDGLDCKLGDAGDPTKNHCTFTSAPAPRQWANIARLTNGALHDLGSVNDLVQGPAPEQWATVSQITAGVVPDVVAADDLTATAGDDGDEADGDKKGKGKARHDKGDGNGKQRNRR